MTSPATNNKYPATWNLSDNPAVQWIAISLAEDTANPPFEQLAPGLLKLSTPSNNLQLKMYHVMLWKTYTALKTAMSFILIGPLKLLWYREYYTATRRFDISLRVLKNILRVSAANEWNIFFNTRREISHLQATMKCSIYYINTNEIPNHFT